MSNSNIVVEWLKSLHLGQYAESFIDNGYDDLEICKQVGDPDLDAIGVISLSHRNRLLQSIRTLREEGAASVYFTLEETAAVHDECHCDKSSIQSTGSSSCHQEFSEKEHFNCKRYGGSTPESSGGSSQESSKFLDEYEEGKAELVKIPRIQLKLLLKEKLCHDGIRLHTQPYSTPSGERGFLEGLASRYADLFNTHYVDVLEYLDELRRYELDLLSANAPDIGSTSQTHTQELQAYNGLPTSLSQPIYIPGKYSPSSCLSDREEDEIYGFGYAANNKQVKQQLQSESKKPQRNCEGCLSPRSVYFYEFPPVGKCADQAACGYHNNKKKSLSRFLRGLKNSHRKERHAPKQEHLNTSLTSQAAALNSSGSYASTSTQLDSEPSNAVRPSAENVNRFEETIQQLKLQDMIRKREEFNRDHEKMIQDIRQGLLHARRGDSSVTVADSIYMYDDEAYFNSSGQHWYDEPPYESDPEDFLMESNSSHPVLPSNLQNGRISFTLNFRSESLGDDTISLPLAGDISLPHDSSNAQLLCQSRRMVSALDYTRTEYSATQIRTAPVASDTSIVDISRRRMIDDPTSSDILNIGSRLSNLLVKTLSSERMDNLVTSSQRYLQSHCVDLKSLPSPLYALPCDAKTKAAQSTLEFSCEASEKKPISFIDRMRGLRQDVQRKFFHLRGSATSQSAENFCDETFSPTSSDGSIPNESGLSFQAVVHNDLVSSYSSSARNISTSPGRSPRRKVSPVIGKAKALVDYIPSPYDKDALRFKKGDIIDIIAMNPSGLWKGMLHNSIGTFKFINVEILTDRRHKGDGKYQAFTSSSQCKPQSVVELLRRINMEDYISVFSLNGFDNLVIFKELTEDDLDFLKITNPEHRAKILTAVDFLHDYDSIHCVEGTYKEPVISGIIGGNPSTSDQNPDDATHHNLHHLNDSLNCSARDSTSSQHHQYYHHFHNSHIGEKSSVLDKLNSRYHNQYCKNTSQLQYGECANGDSEKLGLCCLNGSSNSCDFDVTQDTQPQVFNVNRVTETDILETQKDRSFLSVTESMRNTTPTSDFENPISEFQQECSYPKIPVKSTTSSVHPDLQILKEHISVSNSQDKISSNSYSGKKGKHVSVGIRSDVKAIDLSARNVNFGNSRTQGILRKCKQSAASMCAGEKNSDLTTVNCEVIPSSPSEMVDSFCESNRKPNASKYVTCSNSEILSYDNATFGLNNVRGCSYSEKSSDSGVSSSSLSSTNLKENYSRKESKGGHAIPSAVGSTETAKNFKCLSNKKSPPAPKKTHGTCVSDL